MMGFMRKLCRKFIHGLLNTKIRIAKKNTFLLYTFLVIRSYKWWRKFQDFFWQIFYVSSRNISILLILILVSLNYFFSKWIFLKWCLFLMFIKSCEAECQPNIKTLKFWLLDVFIWLRFKIYFSLQWCCNCSLSWLQLFFRKWNADDHVLEMIHLC